MESTSTVTLMEMMRAQLEQQRAQQQQQAEQQKMLMVLIEEQREELTKYRALHAAPEEKATVRSPKPTLQKLGSEDDVKHFLATFERVAEHQGWPIEVWPTQLAGLLTGKALAAYARLSGENAASYDAVKKAILHRYDINEETHRRRFRGDRKQPEESYKNWGDRLRDHFRRWTRDQPMPLEELMVLDQFLAGAPEELRVWLKERKPQSLQQAQELADDYTLARGSGWPNRKPQPVKNSPPASGTAGNTRQDCGDRPKGDRFSRPRAPVAEGGRAQTNIHGDKRCFQCKKHGHLMYNWPNRQPPTAAGVGRALLASGCDEVAWNDRSWKFLRWAPWMAAQLRC